ncbi:MAG: DUF1080 domain-containing protein, partial [bacterium]|nr:DUF1080 domain-containing protein [bacterium]
DNQWNHYRIEAVGDSIKVFVNGVPCADLVDSVDLKGFIGFQVHQFEGETPAQVRWRNIFLQDLGEHAWEPLFDGTTLAGWKPTGDGEWTVEDGVIRGTAKPAGKGGFLESEQEYADLTVRLQFQAVKGNSGFFFRMGRSAEGKLEAPEAEIDEK